MKKGKIMHKDFRPGSNSLRTVDTPQIHYSKAFLKPVLHWAKLSARNKYSPLKTLYNQCYKIVTIFWSDFFRPPIALPNLCFRANKFAQCEIGFSVLHFLRERKTWKRFKLPHSGHFCAQFSPIKNSQRTCEKNEFFHRLPIRILCSASAIGASEGGRKSAFLNERVNHIVEIP